MAPGTVEPPFLARFLATAEAAAAARPDVDLELAREVFREAATLLDDGLVLDHLDGHDAQAVVDGLCIDLLDRDPGAAVRRRAEAAAAAGGHLHDPDGVCAAYLTVVAVFRL